MCGMGMNFSLLNNNLRIIQTMANSQLRNAGFFIWIDLAPYLSCKVANEEGWEAEKTLKQCITNAGVPISSGSGYQAERPGWFRILFTVEKDALEEALRR